MAASAVPLSSSPSSSVNNQLASLLPCQYTLVATKAKSLINETGNVNGTRQFVVPRVCRLRTRENTMGIYAIADPIGNGMLAADVSINLLVEQLSTISFEDDSYKEKIDQTMQNLSYEIENRLLQMTFDHAEEKVISTTSSVSAAEKLLPALEEAESGAFLFAATVTQSTVYVAYVGTIRAFLISNQGGVLSVSDERPQFYRDGSLHTIDNEDECRRLKSLDVDLNRVRMEGLDKKNSKYTRCIGKLSEKLLSSAASANDVNEARCNPLICEPKCHKFKIHPTDYALVIMTDKVYQMCLKTDLSEDRIPADFVQLLRQSTDSSNAAQQILETIEERFQERRNPLNSESAFQDIGLLIHLFHNPMNSNLPSPLPVKLSALRRPMESEVSVEEVKIFTQKNQEMQVKRDAKTRQSSLTGQYTRETQLHTSTIEPFVRFDGYEKLLNENETLRHADKFITELLYKHPMGVLEEKLNEYIRENPSFMQE